MVLQKDKVKIMYVHGIAKGGENGKKCRYLLKEFGAKNVVCVPMETGSLDFGTYDPREANSVARHLAVNPEIYVWLIGMLLLIFLAVELELYALPPMIPIMFLFLIFNRIPVLIQRAVKKMFIRCVEIQHQAINKHRPDILVGSCLGGAVVVELLRRQLWTGRALLLAPAYKRVRKAAGMHYPPPFPPRGFAYSVPIYHGSKDKIIYQEDSAELIRLSNFTLTPISDVGHGLNSIILNKHSDYDLAELVRKALMD